MKLFKNGISGNGAAAAVRIIEARYRRAVAYYEGVWNVFYVRIWLGNRCAPYLYVPATDWRSVSNR